jgi:glycosyltransferase involved in cell wall biosynthesis
MSVVMLSICIPVYEQPVLLERCLASLAMQTYTNFEVIVTDDSPTNSSATVVERYQHLLQIDYEKNMPAKGFPNNWNYALSKAGGTYLWLLHQDDSLMRRNVIENVITQLQSTQCDVLFGSFEQPQYQGFKAINQQFTAKKVIPWHFLTGNTIGPPSNVIMKHNSVQYDGRFQWLVDVEYYLRLHRNMPNWYYLQSQVIEVGVHEGQMTNICIANPAIALREYTLLVGMYSAKYLNNILYFDFIWRLIRNNITINATTTLEVLVTNAPQKSWLFVVYSWQQLLPVILQKNPVASKTLMLLCYLRLNLFKAK